MIKEAASPKNISLELYKLICDYLHSGHPDLKFKFPEIFIEDLNQSQNYMPKANVCSFAFVNYFSPVQSV